MYFRLLFSLFLAVATSGPVWGQLGGQHVYSFLGLPASARLAALSGAVSIEDEDASLAYINPAVLNVAMDKQLAIHSGLGLAGVNYGYVNYAMHQEAWKLNWHAGLKYVNYGTFVGADEMGALQGEFSANDYALVVGAARDWGGRLSTGVNMKIIASQLESYNSFGIAADVGLAYRDTSGRRTIALVFRHIGSQLTSYMPGGTKEALPFDIQLGISQRLKHLPLRVSVVAHHLHRWNIRYNDPASEEVPLLFGELAPPEESNTSIFFDNLFRHLVFNGEFFLGKREIICLRFGYSHLRRRELSVENFRNLAGFSLGAGLHLRRFSLSYGRVYQHLAGSTSHISLSANLGAFGKL